MLEQVPAKLKPGPYVLQWVNYTSNRHQRLIHRGVSERLLVLPAVGLRGDGAGLGQLC